MNAIIRTSRQTWAVLALVLVCAMSMVAAPTPASSAPLPGDDARLTVSVVPPTDTPIVIAPQTGVQATVAIANSGTGPSTETTLSDFVQSDPSTHGGYAMIRDGYTISWQVWNAAGQWVKNCDAATCAIPPIPAGETWTVTADYFFDSGPQEWMIYEPLDAQEPVQSGQLAEIWFQLDPGDVNSVMCVDCTAIAPAVIGDFAIFETTWTSPEVGIGPPSEYVADPGSTQTFDLHVENRGTGPSDWGAGIDFDGPSGNKGWPDGVASINGLARADLPSGWATTPIPDTPCFVEGRGFDLTMGCREAEPIAPSETATVSFTFVYDDWPPAAADQVGQNFQAHFTASVWTSSSNYSSNCGYNDAPRGPGCAEGTIYAIAADGHVEALSITATPRTVASDGWAETIEWTLQYRNGGTAASLAPENNEIFVPISTGHEFMSAGNGWDCRMVRNRDANWNQTDYSVARCIPDPGRALAPQDVETLQIVTESVDPWPEEVWVGLWDWRAEVEYNDEGGTARSYCAYPSSPTFARLAPTALPPNLAPCGIYEAFVQEPASPADLTITKTSSAAAVKPGESFTWTIKVTNAGAGDAGDVRVTDALPEGTTASVAPAGCVLTGQQIGCDVEALPAGGTLTFPVTVTADDPVPASVLESGEVVNTARVVATNSNCTAAEPCDSTSIVKVTPEAPPTTTTTTTSTVPPSSVEPPVPTTAPPVSVPGEVAPPSSVAPPVSEGAPDDGPLPRTGAPLAVQVLAGLSAGLVGVALLLATRRTGRRCES